MKIGKYNIRIVKNSKLQNIHHYGNSGYFGLNGSMLTEYKFADIILLQMFQKLINAMSSVIWTFEGERYLKIRYRLKRYFEKDFALIYKHLFFDGYVIFGVNYDNDDIVMFNDRTEIIVLPNGVIAPRNKAYQDYKFFTLKSDTFKCFSKSDKEICRDMFRHIDNLLNAINASTENLGAMGILSPAVIPNTVDPLGDKEIERIQTEWREKYGLKIGKWSILITNKPTKFQQINLPIKDLELSQNLETAIKILSGFLQIPYELLPIAGQSTYVNRQEARVGELMEITCRSIANKLYDFATDIFLLKGVKVNWIFENQGVDSEKLLAEKVGVGGIQGIIAILSDIVLQPSQKVNTLITLFGLDKNTAESMVGINQNILNNE